MDYLLFCQQLSMPVKFTLDSNSSEAFHGVSCLDWSIFCPGKEKKDCLHSTALVVQCRQSSVFAFCFGWWGKWRCRNSVGAKPAATEPPSRRYWWPWEGLLEIFLALMSPVNFISCLSQYSCRYWYRWFPANTFCNLLQYGLASPWSYI